MCKWCLLVQDQESAAINLGTRDSSQWGADDVDTANIRPKSTVHVTKNTQELQIQQHHSAQVLHDVKIGLVCMHC